MKKTFVVATVVLALAVAVFVGASALLSASVRRARASANSAFAVGEVRSFVDAQRAFASQAGSFTSPECLASPSRTGCLIGHGADKPAFLDAESAQTERAGYRRTFHAGPRRSTPQNPGGVDSFCYSAVPIEVGTTGNESFAIDHTGKLCVDAAGSNLCAGASLRSRCQELR